MDLIADKLSAGYGPVEIIRSVSFRLESNTLLGVMAPNGAGKSTLFKALSGLCSVQGGQIRIGHPDGTEADITRATSAKRVRAGIRYVPERSDVFADQSIEGNLRLATIAVGRHWTHDIMEAEIAPVFPILAERRHSLAGTLSGGQKRMLSLAMALVQRPRIMLVDEPFAGLAPHIVASLIETLKALKGLGIGLAVIDHNLAATLSFADRVILLRLGEVVLDAPREAVTQERILALFN